MHVAIIPDGNRRWARQRGLPLIAGHRAGSQAWKMLLENDRVAAMTWLTFWGASIDNLTKRPGHEVYDLLGLFDAELSELAGNRRIHQQGVRVRIIGDWSLYLNPIARASAEQVIASTAQYTERNLTLLIAYDGMKAMTDSIRAVVEWSAANPHERITAEVIQRHLVTAAIPPVDLLIRSGGEPHLSAGFLMWEMANAQLIFWEKLWPDVRPADVARALDDYDRRTRRFGA